MCVVETGPRTRPLARVVVTIRPDEDRRRLIDDWVARRSRRS
ncbi:MAG TPA: hypothetical protein VIC57_15565 [Candidatus Dormibacteraeota bacterium]